MHIEELQKIAEDAINEALLEEHQGSDHNFAVIESFAKGIQDFIIYGGEHYLNLTDSEKLAVIIRMCKQAIIDEKEDTSTGFTESYLAEDCFGIQRICKRNPNDVPT